MKLRSYERTLVQRLHGECRISKQMINAGSSTPRSEVQPIISSECEFDKYVLFFCQEHWNQGPVENYNLVNAEDAY